MAVRDAADARQKRAAAGCSPFLGGDPGPVLPRRIVPDVLPMSALEVSDPVARVVLMESHYAARNR
jgi:hypothetical protein